MGRRPGRLGRRVAVCRAGADAERRAEPRYFGQRRGLTWLNAINDQVAGIGAVVVPGTMRDPLQILVATPHAAKSPMMA